MDIEPPIIAVIVVVILLGGAGAYVVLKDDTPTADRPTWSVGYDWWYDDYERTEGNGTEEEWDESYQLRVNGLEDIQGTAVYNTSRVDTNNSRLQISDLQRFDHISKSTLNPVDEDTGEEELPLYRWPLEDGKSWSFTEDNMTFKVNVEYMDEVKVPAGKFEAFKVTLSTQETDENMTLKIKMEVFYCDKVKNHIRQQYTVEVHENGTLAFKGMERNELLAYGLSDKDSDGISDGGERWLGTDPKLADTDGDNATDGSDYTPLFDLQATLELRRFATSDNCETLVEDQIQGESSGCDVYIILTNSVNSDEHQTDTTNNQGNFDMQETYIVDVSDDLEVFHFYTEALDEDSSSADDTIDINEFMGHGMDLRLDVYDNRWSDSPTNVYEAGNEYTTSGNGGGDYDGDLTWFLTDSSVVST